MDIKKMLDEEIERSLSSIASMEQGSEGRKAAISELNQIHKLRIDEEKIQLDRESAFDEEREKTIQHRDQAIERCLKYGAIALELVVPIVAYSIWYRTGLKFEETGTVTSSMTKSLIAKMLPKKK